MKKLRVIVNDKQYTIEFDYIEETDTLITNIKDKKNKLLNKRQTDLILESLLKGYKTTKEVEALCLKEKEDTPLKVYTDTDNVLNKALFYKNNDFDSMKEIELYIPRLTIGSFLNKGYTYLTIILLLGMIIGFCNEKIKEKNYYENIGTYQETVQDNFDLNYLLDSILTNPNLREEYKELFYNEKLFRDIANTPMSLERKTILCYNLYNLNVKDYNFIQKGIYEYKDNKNEQNNPYAYVETEDYRKNTINIYSQISEESRDVVLHEFAHILQQNDKYFYLNEAVAEIIAHEYWDRPIFTYQNAVKRLYILMEILDPSVVWNTFFGNEQTLINELNKYLTTEEVNMFLTCLEQKPYDNDYDIKEDTSNTDIELDRLLSILYERKYNSSIKDNEKINNLYNMTSRGELTYTLGEETINIPIYYFNKEVELQKPVQLTK